jgi:hypothetical protein
MIEQQNAGPVRGRDAENIASCADATFFAACNPEIGIIPSVCLRGHPCEA